MGEFLTSKAGIGHLIMYGSQVFNLNLIITGVFILCIVASIMYYGVVLLEKKLIPNGINFFIKIFKQRKRIKFPFNSLI